MLTPPTKNVPPPEVTMDREKEIWALRLRMWSQQRIADKLGVSQSAISQALTKMTNEFKERHYANIDKVKFEQVSQLVGMADEAYQAWEKSKETAYTVRQKSVHGIDIDKMSEARQQFGDVRYLEQVRKFLEDIRKIMGADAPIKGEFTGPNGTSIPITLEGRIAKIASLYDEAAAGTNLVGTGCDSSGEETP